MIQKVGLNIILGNIISIYFIKSKNFFKKLKQMHFSKETLLFLFLILCIVIFFSFPTNKFLLQEYLKGRF